MKTMKLFSMFCLTTAFCFAGCSKKGPTGPQGSQGEQGKQGTQGPQGIPGADGSTIYSDNSAPAAKVGKVGDYYLDKSTGNLYGPKTDKGWGNPISLKGPKGDKGNTGAEGEKRDKGSKGDKSEPGATGPQGSKGDKGNTGVQGSKGETGAKGPQGPKGDPGKNGKEGSQILSGTTNPVSSVGSIGDYYWDASGFSLYGPKTTSGWGSGIGLRGPKGEKGDKGDSGNANIISSGWILTKYNWKNKKTGLGVTFTEPGDLDVAEYLDYKIDAKNAEDAAILVLCRQWKRNQIRTISSYGKIQIIPKFS